jgi:hypothetical protein
MMKERLMNEEEALEEVRVEEYEARLDDLEAEIEPFERHLKSIEARSRRMPRADSS